MGLSEKPSVLITGASTGIGAACVIELDRLGWQVFAGVRREEDGRRLQALASPAIIPVYLDVTEPESIRQASEKIDAIVGPSGLSGLVNNGGICVTGPLECLPMEDLRLQIEVNLLGQIGVTQVMLPLLRRAKGRIVNMGSVSGRVTAPLLGPYSISKRGLESATDAMRMELRRWGIRVSIIEPGPIQTPIWEKSYSKADEMCDRLSEKALDLYGKDIEAVRKSTEQSARHARPVSTVAERVVHALSAKRPKFRYTDCWRTRLMIFLSDHIKESWMDAIILRSIKYPR
jgi:NAD(P)-dependent dehydrogenase (short-subunit alcohol dehydrogenase family)